MAVFVVALAVGVVAFLVTGFSVSQLPGAAVVVIVVAVALVMLATKRRASWSTWYRLANFAHANGWGMQPRVSDLPYPGMLFTEGRERIASERVYTIDGRFFDIANYRYTTGSGKNSRTHTWHYIAVKLERRLPNIVLDARANNGLFGSNLPTTLARDQVLSLEGNFDDHFTLYCPAEYERDALYIFTPDLMALLIDSASLYDVEIVDDWIFFYSSATYEALDATAWARMLQIAEVAGAKAADRTERYRDEHLVRQGTPPLHSQASTGNRVAAPGRRLRRGVNWTLVATIGAVAVYWIATHLLF